MTLAQEPQTAAEGRAQVLSPGSSGSWRSSSPGAGSARREDSGAFECRTCGRRFPSFQALGGHRTGHTRRHTLLPAASTQNKASPSHRAPQHECAVCGLEFPMGQALGGHMRRHRLQEPADRHASRGGVEEEDTLDLNRSAPKEKGQDCPHEEGCSSSSGGSDSLPRLLNLLV